MVRRSSGISDTTPSPDVLEPLVACETMRRQVQSVPRSIAGSRHRAKGRYRICSIVCSWPAIQDDMSTSQVIQGPRRGKRNSGRRNRPAMDHKFHRTGGQLKEPTSIVCISEYFNARIPRQTSRNLLTALYYSHGHYTACHGGAKGVVAVNLLRSAAWCVRTVSGTVALPSGLYPTTGGVLGGRHGTTIDDARP